MSNFCIELILRRRFSKKLYFLLQLFLFLGSVSSIRAEAKELSLTEVLQMKVSVASLRDLTTRESPGILTVITQADIEKSGAKDLIDLLRNVPGFYFTVDIANLIYLGSRGMYSGEGKVLFMVDGLEQNEQAYGTMPLLNRYPVSQIKRVEIIRGPGSVIYGGFAGLNVINIITKKGGDVRGGEAELTVGEMKDTYGHNSISMLYGQEKDGLAASVGGFVGRSRSSDREYKDYPPFQANGDPIDMKRGSRVDPHFVNAGFEYNGFEFRTQQDSYETTNVDGWGGGNLMEDEVHFRNNILNAKKKFSLGKLKITPEWTYMDGKPFENPDPMTDMIDDNEIRQRTTSRTGRLLFEYDLNEKNNLIFGAEKRWKDILLETAWTDRDPPQRIQGGIPLNNKKERMENAYFAQYMHMSNLGNVTLGLRHDDVEDRSKITVPRFGYTKIFGDMHLKALWAKSFKEPTTSAVAFGAADSEKITTSELEFGYQFTSNMMANINIFHSVIDNPVAYGFDNVTSMDGYLNYGIQKNIGSELEARYISEAIDALINYSYYKTAEIEADPMQPIGTDKAIFAIPQNMLNFKLTYKVIENLFVTPQAHYIGKIYSMKWNPAVGDMSEFVEDPKTIFDLYLYSRDQFLKGLSFGVGASNLTNTEENFHQAYVKTGWHAPQPSASREIYTKISYNAEF